MMRLLQGEVGSGKTMVATCAMLQAVDLKQTGSTSCPDGGPRGAARGVD